VRSDQSPPTFPWPARLDPQGNSASSFLRPTPSHKGTGHQSSLPATSLNHGKERRRLLTGQRPTCSAIQLARPLPARWSWPKTSEHQHHAWCSTRAATTSTRRPSEDQSTPRTIASLPTPSHRAVSDPKPSAASEARASRSLTLSDPIKEHRLTSRLKRGPSTPLSPPELKGLPTTPIHSSTGDTIKNARAPNS